MSRCLLNIDLGELPDEPEELYRLAHLANIACGGHAGDDASMRLALQRCATHAVQAGAHPSYPDRAGFGRVAMTLSPAELEQTVREQCAALRKAADAVGVPLHHVKPHGALYHAADGDPALARALIAGAVDALDVDIAVVGPPGGCLAAEAERQEVWFLREGFADRGLLPDGSLVPRGEPGALVTDPAAAAEQALRLAASRRFDTLCVHGDGPTALAVAAAVRAALDRRGT